MVLLVVDAQNGIVDERLYEFRKFVGNIKKLIEQLENKVQKLFMYSMMMDLVPDSLSGMMSLRSIPSLNRCLMKNDLLSLYAVRSKESGLLEYLTAKEEKT